MLANQYSNRVQMDENCIELKLSIDKNACVQNCDFKAIIDMGVWVDPPWLALSLKGIPHKYLYQTYTPYTAKLLLH